MKKILSVVLVALMLLSLAACGAKEPPQSQITPNPTGTAPTVPGGTVETTPDTTEDTAAQTGGSVSLGQMQGGVYTNTYAGFACTLDANWAYMTAEQLQELPGNAAELLEGTAIDADKIEATMIADMMAENIQQMCNINVQYQKLDLSQRVVFAKMTSEEVIDETLKQKDTLISTYEQAGMTDVTVEKKTVTFLGEEHAAIYTTASVGGVPTYILQLQDYSKGAYGVVLTLTSFIEDNSQMMLDLFTKA